MLPSAAEAFSPALLVPTAKATGIALSVLGLVRVARWAGAVSTPTARKMLHCLIGPVFMACWNMWPADALAGPWAAVVPGGIVAFFALVGQGVISDPGTVSIMARTGRAAELMVGPLEYGIVCVALTAGAFRSLLALSALMALFFGDAAAELAGRAVQAAALKRRGGALVAWLARPALPVLPARKSLAGTCAYFSAALLGAAAMTAFGLSCGWTELLRAVPASASPLASMAAVLVAGAAGGALAEAATDSDHDNLTGPAGAAAAALASGWALGVAVL
ncbi:hypothetical protein FNF28_01258 [Cafeteria roenbergensis]|uniref:Dolichol kinase n=3 Tax=Cafeteria roenbergensis TaxID=33653 RepID=A0A5A8E199_CAFRO|nr:hypothetical protein FNF28_01258 [Cafeteria roenbergensis]